MPGYNVPQIIVNETMSTSGSVDDIIEESVDDLREQQDPDHQTHYHLDPDDEEGMKNALTHGVKTRPRSHSRSGFGSKDITLWGSVILNLNNSMGPAMVLLPMLMQIAGYIMPILALLGIYILSSLSATMLCEAIQRIPGNDQFAVRYEFSTIVKHYYGNRWYYFTQAFYIISLIGFNISAMIISSTVLDNFVILVAGHSWGLNYSGEGAVFITSDHNYSDPWSGNFDVISVGFVIAMVICIPFGYLNLEENMWFQWFSFAGLMFFTLEFWVQFILNAFVDPEHYAIKYIDAPPNGPGLTPAFNAVGQSQVLGITIFAFAYVITIPSWINEKRPAVSVNKAIWWPATIAFVMKLITGLLGGWAFVLYFQQPDGTKVLVPGANDILNSLASDKMPAITQYCNYLWTITTLIPGIPVLSIMIRYNLLSGKVLGKYMSFFVAVVAPWIVVMFIYQRPILNTIVNWLAIVVQGFVNFVIPIMIYRKALILYPRPEDHPRLLENDLLTEGLIPHYRTKSHLSVDSDFAIPDVSRGNRKQQEKIQSVPNFVTRWIRPLYLANILAAFFTLLCICTIILNIVTTIDPPSFITPRLNHTTINPNATTNATNFF